LLEYIDGPPSARARASRESGSYARRMDRTRLTGAVLMAITAVQALLFLIGLARRSYLALAVPVFLLVASVSVLGFWVGWTLATMEDDLTGLAYEAEPLDEP
jgi:hypothetical protein